MLRALSLCTCCRHYPGAATGGTASLIHPVVSAFPERVAGSACASAFSRLAQRSLTLRPAHSRCHQFVTRLPEGFSHFVTSMTAPVASGWSGCRAGLTPAGKRRLFTAHTHFSPSIRRDVNGSFQGTSVNRQLYRPASTRPKQPFTTRDSIRRVTRQRGTRPKSVDCVLCNGPTCHRLARSSKNC